jgi:NAD(P)-dependent dehydrogenase (short-subunit alcohol dehydrogenase family)
VPLSLTDFDALDRLAGAIEDRWGRLDALFGNAGMLGPLAPLGHVSPKEWQGVMDVNVTANWRLIKAMDGLLRASDAGRAAFVSSGAAHKCTAYWGPYSVSKAAVEALARTYAAETATTPVTVMLVNPGPLRTKMRAEAVPGEDPMTLRTPEELAVQIVPMLSPGWSRSGEIFDFPTGSLKSHQAPA